MNSKNVRHVDTRKPVCSINSSKLVRLVNSNNSVLPVDICTVDSNKPLGPVDSSKLVRPGDVCKPIPSVNYKIVRPVDARKPVCPVSSRKPVLPIDVCKSVHPVNSNKSTYRVRKPACLVDIRKSFFVDYWKHVTFFLVLFFVFSINTSVFNRTILYMILFINIYMTYSIFS